MWAKVQDKKGSEPRQYEIVCGTTITWFQNLWQFRNSISPSVACPLLQCGLLSTVRNSKEHNRFRWPDKWGVTPVIALPLELYDLSSIEVPHVWVSEGWGFFTSAGVQVVKEVLILLQLHTSHKQYSSVLVSWGMKQQEWRTKSKRDCMGNKASKNKYFLLLGFKAKLSFCWIYNIHYKGAA